MGTLVLLFNALAASVSIWAGAYYLLPINISGAAIGVMIMRKDV